MLENLVKYLSAITIFAFVLGYYSLSSFYGQFNIPILNYISTTEILYELLPPTALIFIFTQLIVQIALEDTKNQVTSNEAKKQPSNRRGLIFSLIFAAAIGVLFITLESKFGVYRAKPYVTLIFYASIFFSSIKVFGRTILQQSMKAAHFVGIFVIIGLTMSQYQLASAAVIKRFGTNKKYSFTWKGKTIKSDTTLYAIGETRAYLFFYSRKDSSTSVYRRADIDSLVVKANLSIPLSEYFSK